MSHDVSCAPTWPLMAATSGDQMRSRAVISASTPENLLLSGVETTRSCSLGTERVRPSPRAGAKATRLKGQLAG